MRSAIAALRAWAFWLPLLIAFGCAYVRPAHAQWESQPPAE